MSSVRTYEALSDRKIGLLVLPTVFALSLAIGIALAWHSHMSGIATPV